MTSDWRKIIAVAFLVRQRLAEVDGGLWPFHLPEVAATEKDILACEATLGETLPTAYREFLKRANGWIAFYQAVDLFGLSDLQSGKRYERALSFLEPLDPLEPVCGLELQEVMPVGVSQETGDLFLLAKSLSRKPGQVFWVAGQLVQEFTDFEEFFLAMIDYNREDVRDFEREAGLSH